MPIQFYKPNSKVTGSACSFWYNSRDNSFFGCIIKQDSWDSNTKTGSFARNKENPEGKVVIKLSAIEVASILDVLESNREFKGYHDSPNGTHITTFIFAPYMRDGKQVGFSFSASKADKKDSTKKVGAIIGFNFGEARLLREQLSFLLKEQFNLTESRILHTLAPAGSTGPASDIGTGSPAQKTISHPADILEI